MCVYSKIFSILYAGTRTAHTHTHVHIIYGIFGPIVFGNVCEIKTRENLMVAVVARVVYARELIFIESLVQHSLNPHVTS